MDGTAHTSPGEGGGARDAAERPPSPTPAERGVERLPQRRTLDGKAGWMKAAAAKPAHPKATAILGLAVAAAEQAKKEQKERAFCETKDAVEQIMEWKVQQRRAVSKVFLWDCSQLLFYLCFLMLFSINSWKNPDTYQLHNIKSIVDGVFEGGKFPLSGVSDITGVYAFLENTVVPAVSMPNMTILDPRCTADGRHRDPTCLEDPFSDEGKCCYKLHPGCFFCLGSASKNMLVTPLSLRQQRVWTDYVKTPWGTAWRWPALSEDTQETREGGGTMLDDDREGFLLDWPTTASWYNYHRCSGPEDCTYDDRLGDRKMTKNKPIYSQSGYVASLEGTTEQILEEIERLKKYRFLGGATRGVFLDFAAYFPGESLYCTVSILFEIGPSDFVVSPSMSIRVSDLRQASDMYFWRRLDYVVFVFALLLFLIDVFKIIKNYSEWILDVWNYFALINYAFFMYSFYLVADLDYTLDQPAPKGIKGVLPMSQEARGQPWVYFMMRMDKYYDIASFNCIWSWFRTIRYLEQMSPAFKQVILTITQSLGELFTFSIILGICAMGFTFAFNLQFGVQVAEYSTVAASAMSLFRLLLGDFDWSALDNASPTAAWVYFILYFIFMIFLMINMVLGIIVKTYDHVAAELEKKARTEVTGVSMLKQSIRALFRLMSARSIDDLKKVSPSDDASAAQLYGLSEDDIDIFSRDKLTEVEFRILFGDDDEALHRIGVRSVEELMRYADATGKPELDMGEVNEYVEKLNAVAGKKKEETATFAPAQLAQIRQTLQESMEQRLEAHSRSLKDYIYAQISQATLIVNEPRALHAYSPVAAGRGASGPRSNPSITAAQT